MIKNKVDRLRSMKGYVMILTLFLSLSFISAVGVSTPYWSTNPLKLQPGESTVISLGLQNMVGTEDVTLRASIVKGSEIARIIDDDLDYFIPIGSESDVAVNLEVKIPANAEVDKIQDIEVSFVQVAQEDQGGFFSIASAFTQRIPVLVVGEPTESAIYAQTTQKGIGSTIWVIIGLIVVLIIAIAVQANKKRQ